MNDPSHLRRIKLMMVGILLTLCFSILAVILLVIYAKKFGNPDAANIFCRLGLHPYWFRPDEHKGYLECPVCGQKDNFDTDLKF